MNTSDPKITEFIREACSRSEADWLGRENGSFETYFPAYDLCLKVLRDGHGLESAIQTGWRVVMTFPDKRAEFGIVAAATPGSPPELVSVSDGEFTAGALSHLREVHTKLDMRSGEVRWLSIPGIMFEGFWLPSEPPGKSDLVLPVKCLDDELRGKVLEVNMFLPVAQEYAVWRLAFDDCPVGDDLP